VAVIGELDSLRVPEHPYADPVTGAAHACGHHAQIGMMLGTVIGLLSSGVLAELSGRVVPFAVPAEEFIEAERRMALREQGKLEFMGGKQELIRLGEFDDVDMAIMCHTASDMGDKWFGVGGTSNGHIVKYVQFIGRSAHAGGMPHMGINALNAAMIALMAIHSNRETLREEDTVRIHGILTKGGEAATAVPSDVRLEWRVRASSIDAVAQTNAKVDRCFKAGALAVGAKVRITNIPGYLPMLNDLTLQELFHRNAVGLLGPDRVLLLPPTRNRGGSTDMGDLSHIIPVCHPYTSGAVGTGHGKDYIVKNYELAVINPAKLMAMVVIDLLAEGARKAREVLSKARPPLTKEQYISLQRQRAEVIEYDGAAA
jgi:amidohydrolase